jgi:DNA-binding response OmpR family regulator
MAFFNAAVLLVEDDDSIAEPLVDGLARYGFQVNRVGTGAAALAAPRAAMVLLDLGLPDIDGLEVCRQMRRTGDIPVIMLTARGDEADRVAGLELGADDYLAKPFSVRELVARMRAARRMTRRLLFTYLTFALLILVGLEVPLGYVQQRNEQHQAFEQLEVAAEVLAVFVDSALSSNDLAKIDVLAHETALCLGGQVDIVNAHGTVLSSTQPSTAVSAAAPNIRTVLSGQVHASTRTAMSAGVEVMSVAVPIRPGLAPHGAIRVSVPSEAMMAGADRFQLVLVVPDCSFWRLPPPLRSPWHGGSADQYARWSRQPGFWPTGRHLRRCRQTMGRQSCGAWRPRSPRPLTACTACSRRSGRSSVTPPTSSRPRWPHCGCGWKTWNPTSRRRAVETFSRL